MTSSDCTESPSPRDLFAATLRDLVIPGLPSFAMYRQGPPRIAALTGTPHSTDEAPRRGRAHEERLHACGIRYDRPCVTGWSIKWDWTLHHPPRISLCHGLVDDLEADLSISTPKAGCLSYQDQSPASENSSLCTSLLAAGRREWLVVSCVRGVSMRRFPSSHGLLSFAR